MPAQPQVQAAKVVKIGCAVDVLVFFTSPLLVFARKQGGEGERSRHSIKVYEQHEQIQDRCHSR